MTVSVQCIQATIDAPQVIEVPHNRKTVSIDVRATLLNTSENTMVLHVPGDNYEFWHVLDENQREVQRDIVKPKRKAKVKKDMETFCSLTLAAGLANNESETLVLDTSKLKDGHTYAIRCEVWGQSAETRFVVAKPARLAKLTPAKKAVTKKAPAKKATAKKAAPKKAASKAKSRTAAKKK